MENTKKTIHSKKYAQLIELLQKARADAGVTQRDLAAKLNVSHSLVAKVEMGERRIDIIETVRWLEALGASPKKFFLDWLKDS